MKMPECARVVCQRMCGIVLVAVFAVSVLDYSTVDERKADPEPAASCELEAHECTPAEKRVFALKYQI